MKKFFNGVASHLGFAFVGSAATLYFLTGNVSNVCYTYNAIESIKKSVTGYVDKVIPFASNRDVE